MTLPSRERALEDGAGPLESQENPILSEVELKGPDLTSDEQLRVRVAALEAIVISLLAHASDRQLGLLREIAVCDTASVSSIHRRLRIPAAHQITDLVTLARRLSAVR